MKQPKHKESIMPEALVDMRLSVEIYNHLMNGRIINSQRLGSHGDFETNPMFEEVMQHLEVYTIQYEMCGFSLVANSDFFYIAKGYLNDISKTEIAMKAYCLLLLIGKYMTTQNYKIERLSSAGHGLSLAEINKISLMPDTEEILQRAGLNDDLLKSIKSVLMERQIILENPITQNFVLSASGQVFFEELIERFVVH